MIEDAFDPKRFALLADLGEDDRDALVEVLELQRVATGRKLFREGGEADGLVLVESGRIVLSSKRTGARSEVGPGDAVGVLSLFAIGPREATASTIEPCVVWKLPRAHWRRLCEDAPRTACRVLEAAVR